MTSVQICWAEALLASLWQAPIIAMLAWLVDAAWARRATTRHSIAALALFAIPLVMAATAAGLLPSLEPAWASSPSLPPSGASEQAASSAPWVERVLVIWLLGAMLMSARTIVQGWRVRTLRRETHPLPSQWQARAETLARRLNVRLPALALTTRCDVPLVLGTLRPMVLLPAGLLAGVEPAVVEAALAHELMHIRRLDPWILAMQRAIEIVLFFNPGVWWLSRRVSAEREHACDEGVLAARGQRTLPYARALVALEEWRLGPAPALTLGMGGPGLSARIRRLVAPHPVAPVRRWGARAALALLLGTLVGLGTLWPSPPQQVPHHGDPLGVVWLPDGVRRYQAEIAGAATRHGVDPGLLAIMVWAESRGRPNARSPVGARGLLQLMPSTAADIAKRRGLPEHGLERLDEPAYNLDLGAWYMARQIERYEDVELALAAYNAGPGRVAAFQRGDTTLPEETQHYQTTVMALLSERALPYSPTLAQHGG